MSTWLGLDTALGTFGFAVVGRPVPGPPVVLKLGTWRTKVDAREGKLADRARRVHDLFAALNATIDEYRPTDAYVESLALGMQTSRSTAQSLGRVRGLVEGVCYSRGIVLAEVRPDVAKQAVTGRRDASKEEVAEVLKRLYGLTAHTLSLDATDALAIAHVGAHRSGVNLSSGVVKYQPSSEDELDLLGD